MSTNRYTERADRIAETTDDGHPVSGAPRPVCECYHDCRDCSRSGDWHVHPGEPCPIHPDAEGDR